MKSLDDHFENVRRIALAETESAAGCEELVNCLPPPFETLKKTQIEDWVEKLSNNLARKCWNPRNLNSFPELNRSHLLFVAETGEVPEFVTIGFPVLDVPYTFEDLGGLATQSTMMLPQLVDAICADVAKPDPYFECVDLYRCPLATLGLALAQPKDISTGAASRLLADSVALLSMIKSWRSVAPKPGAVVFFCASTGSHAFGRPLCIQE